MSLFTSSREKKLWLYVVIIIAAISVTLVIGQPLQKLIRNQNIQAIIFMLGMLLTAITIIVYSLKSQSSKKELAVWIGIAAVYLMLFLRLGISERSHLIEYSVLAIFVFQAFRERFRNQKHLWKAALFSVVFSIIIGAFDEFIQIFLPDRVFDPIDIFFNSFAIIMAIGGSLIIRWIRSKVRSNKSS